MLFNVVLVLLFLMLLIIVLLMFTGRLRWMT